MDRYIPKGVTWDNLSSYLPPGQDRCQWDSLVPVKHFSTFRFGASDHKVLKNKRIDWSLLVSEGSILFDSLGFPYDSSTLAVGPLCEIFQRQLEAALSFSLPGPLVLHLENRCCEKKVCPLHVFYAGLVYLLSTSRTTLQ